jgi:hypothetical protein
MLEFFYFFKELLILILMGIQKNQFGSYFFSQIFIPASIFRISFKKESLIFKLS